MSTVEAPIPARPNTLVEAVAANIRAECALRGIQQQQLAAAIGLSRTSVTDRWWGRRQWQLEDLEKVARLFGLDAAELCRVKERAPVTGGYRGRRPRLRVAGRSWARRFQPPAERLLTA